MFDEIASLSQDAQRMFEHAAQQLVATGELHQLFDLRLLQRRYELRLPLDQLTTLDDVDEPLRSQLEQSYLEACRESGQLLLKADRAREAWMYLRPAGEKKALRRWLERAVPREETAEELIELALREGVDPQRGFAWLLARNGTCNAITELEAACAHLTPVDQQECVAVLVRHLRAELIGNLRRQLQRQGENLADESSIEELLNMVPAPGDEAAYHIDTSHLATTVQFARLLTDRATLAMAIELAEYGNQLEKDLQYSGQPPFEDLYPTSLLLFRATLGQQVQQAQEYFQQRAQEAAAAQADQSDESGAPTSTAAVETYLILLDRVGCAERALDEYSDLVATNCNLSPHAPTLLQLAERSGSWDRYLEICRERGDLLGFAAGQLARSGDA